MSLSFSGGGCFFSVEDVGVASSDGDDGDVDVVSVVTLSLFGAVTAEASADL
jgi:hypothetical protein